MSEREWTPPKEAAEHLDWLKQQCPKAWAVATAEQRKEFAEDPLKPLSSWGDLDGLLGPIEWHWDQWLAAGFNHLLAGEPGLGKSWIALKVGATFIRGDPWLDGTPFTGPKGDILWCECEAAQAINLDRARDWQLPLERIKNPFDDPLEALLLESEDHWEALRRAANQPNIVFIVLDSLGGLHTSEDKSNRAGRIIKRLGEIARDTGKPMLTVCQLRKRNVFDTNGIVTLDRLRGPYSIAHFGRLIWALDSPNPESQARRLAVIKSNLARWPEPLGLTIDSGVIASCEVPQPPKTETLQDRVAALLLDLLSDGAVPAADIQEEIEHAGLSWNVAKKMKSKLGILSVKPEGTWHWTLPGEQEPN